MRIKIIGDNNCARATRHLLRLAGFAVTEYLPADAVTGGPLAGYTITIDLAPAPHTPEARLRQDYGGQALLRPDFPTQQLQTSVNEEASHMHRDASSPAFVPKGGTTAGSPAIGAPRADKSAVAPASFRRGGGIHFDSVDSALEAAVLRHVTQLAASPVILDRHGGVVHSDREVRIIAPITGDAKTDEAAAVAIEFGVLRGLLDLTAPAVRKSVRERSSGGSELTGHDAEEPDEAPPNSRRARAKKWWPFGILLLAGALGLMRTGIAAAPKRFMKDKAKTHRLKPVLLGAAPLLRAGLAAVAPGFAPEPQGQFVTGQGFKITDGTNFLVVDPCKAQTKLYASISQTANTQLVTGSASKKIFVCSIHVVAAAATNVAVVEGTGSVCATGTAGLSGFGGATAATGWNFAANGGIALGNGDSSLGAEGTSGDNLCIFNSGSGQVSGGISYVVQ